MDGTGVNAQPSKCIHGLLLTRLTRSPRLSTGIVAFQQKRAFPQESPDGLACSEGLQALRLQSAVSNRPLELRQSHTEYQRVAGAIKKTATRDLNDLKEKGIIEKIGIRGPGVHYVVAKKRDKKGTVGT